MAVRLISSAIMPEPNELLEMGGIQEFYADFAIPQPHGDVVRFLLCRDPITTGRMFEVTGMVVMPHAGWLRSHAWAQRLAEHWPGK